MLTITSLYAALFAVILLPITIRVGLSRIATETWFLDGGDDILLKRIRSQANFLEYVPFALCLMALVEIGGASATYLHAIGGILLVSRVMHYITLNTNPIAMTRPISKAGTFAVFIMCAGWLLNAQIA